jgi:hypothetical protein
MVRESEPLFTLLQTTDDDVELANDGGPSTRYRDDPSQPPLPSSASFRRKDDGAGPETLYKDDPGASIFNWDGGDDDEEKRRAKNNHRGGHAYRIDDDLFDVDDVGFSPVRLHDDDDDVGGGNGRTVGGIRAKANELLKKRVFDDEDQSDEEEDNDDERIFVGGGWGRHGSQTSWCPRGFCSRCTRSKHAYSKPLSYSKGPPTSTARGSAVLKVACLTIAFLAAVIGCGYLGYEAGLPADDDDGTSDRNATTMGGIAIREHHPHTKGDKWLEASSKWVEHEKETIHRPHWNFHKFNKGKFKPMSQSDLLKLSKNVFQSCSERSLLTTPGRNACMSLCHGHYCCFEKEEKFGGCVSTRNSYCFAFAACESVIGDFMMTNANAAVTKISPDQGISLNALDAKLLEDACSEDSLATLDGIRDCNAFCQHHLCCFSESESESCLSEHMGECQAYNACRSLVNGSKTDAKTEVADGGGGEANDYPSSANGESDSDGGASDSQGEDGLASAEVADGLVDDGRGVENDDSNGGGGGAQSAAPDKNSAIDSAVHAVCDLAEGDESWVTACHALCANYLCCFSTDGTLSNCRDTYGDAVCDAYQGCKVLLLPSNHPEEEEVPHMDTSNDGGDGDSSADIQWEETEEGRMHEMCEACLPTARVDPVLADRCRKVCEPRSCCWQDGPGKCATLNEGWCGEYQACSVLHSP